MIFQAEVEAHFILLSESIKGVLYLGDGEVSIKTIEETMEY